MTLKLTGLRTENYKRITLADIKFDPTTGGVVALMGRNEQGKSSFLDAFEALIAGRKAPKMSQPIHAGADFARIVATFDESDGSKLVVTRKYSANGSTSIEVRQDGLRVAKADEILSRLYSHVALDPLEFANLGSKEQVETLVKLIGFDPAKLDREAANVFATRTEVGRDVERLAAQSATVGPYDSELPDELVDVAALAQRIDASKEREREHKVLGGIIVGFDDQIAQMQKRVLELNVQRAQAMNEKADLPYGEDLTPLTEQMQTVEATNEQVRRNRQARSIAEDLEKVKAERQRHTERLYAIREEKTASFAKAADRMPIPGLTVEDGEVFLDGTPFSQTSAGGKLRTSTAIAMALNPELRAIVIRDGSLLDSENRAVIDGLAKANDFTVLMEIVDETAPAGIVFEDGTATVKGEGLAAAVGEV